MAVYGWKEARKLFVKNKYFLKGNQNEKVYYRAVLTNQL